MRLLKNYWPNAKIQEPKFEDQDPTTEEKHSPPFGYFAEDGARGRKEKLQDEVAKREPNSK
jgi:hypothetical protein